LLGGKHLLDLELSAAQNEGKSETISSPRVITANQKQATICRAWKFRIRNPLRAAPPPRSSRTPCCRSR
jgi:hypothetical protein